MPCDQAMHKGLCRGHGGSVWLVWLIEQVRLGAHVGVNSFRGRPHPSNPAPYMSQGCPWASCKPPAPRVVSSSHLYPDYFF